MNLKIFIYLSISFLLLLSGCSGQNSDDTDTEKEKTETVVNNNYRYITDDINITITKKDDMLVCEDSDFILYNITANWCGACEIMQEQLLQIDKKYGSSLMIITLDVDRDADRELLMAVEDLLGIDRNFTVPLVALFRDSRYVKQYSLMPQEMLERDIEIELKRGR